MYMKDKTFYDIQKEAYKKSIKIKKVKLVDEWYYYAIKIKIIDYNRIIKNHTLSAFCITAPSEEELDRRVEEQLNYYIYSRIKNKCADYAVKKYNEKLQEELQ